jgi:nitroreductase
VVVISSPQDVPKIPQAEQVLSAGALCLGLVNAATAAGWGANWLTGWVSHDAAFVAEAFGCKAGETVAGIVHIGTAGAPAPERPRPDLARVVRWGL